MLEMEFYLTKRNIVSLRAPVNVLRDTPETEASVFSIDIVTSSARCSGMRLIAGQTWTSDRGTARMEIRFPDVAPGVTDGSGVQRHARGSSHK